jgi:hypothetical protein
MPAASTAHVARSTDLPDYVPGAVAIDISKFLARRPDDCPCLADGYVSTLPGLTYSRDGDKVIMHSEFELIGHRTSFLDPDYFCAFADPGAINAYIAPGLSARVQEQCRYSCLTSMRKYICMKNPIDPNCPHSATPLDRRMSKLSGNWWTCGRLTTAEASSTSALRLCIEEKRQDDVRAVLDWYDLPFGKGHLNVVGLLSAGSLEEWPAIDSDEFPLMVVAAKILAAHHCVGVLERQSAHSQFINPVVGQCMRVVLLSAYGASPSEAATQSRVDSPLFQELSRLTATFNLSLLQWLQAVCHGLSDIVIEAGLPEADHDAAVLQAVTNVLVLYFSPVGYSCSELPLPIEKFLKDNMLWNPPVGPSPSKPGSFSEGADLSLDEIRAAFAEYTAIAESYAMRSGYLTTMEAPLSVQPTTARKTSQRLAATHGGGNSPRPIPPVPEKLSLDLSGDKVTSHLEGYGHAKDLLGSRSATSTLANSASPTAFARPAGVAAAGAAAFQFGGGLQPLRTDPVAGSATGATNPGMTMYDGTASASASAAAPPHAAAPDMARIAHLEQQLAQLRDGDRQFGHNPPGHHPRHQAPAADTVPHQHQHQQLQQQQPQSSDHPDGVGSGHASHPAAGGGAYHHLAEEYHRHPQQQAPHPPGQRLDGSQIRPGWSASAMADFRALLNRHAIPDPGYTYDPRQVPPPNSYQDPPSQPHSGDVGFHHTSMSRASWNNGRDTGGPPPHVQSHRPQDRVVAGYSRAHPGDLCLSGGPVPHPSALPTQQYDLRPPPFYVPHAGTTPFMQRQYDDVAQPAAGAFAPNVSSVPEPWNLCGDVFANVNIASPELTAQAFGELHDLQTPLVYASKNCEQSYWERHNLISSHQQNILIKNSASGTCIEELKRRFASEAADARFANTSTVKEFTATPDAFDSMVSSMQSLCNSMSRPFRFGSLQHVFISQSRDFVLSLALFKATQLQAGVPWSDIMTRFRSLFASFAALRTFCEQRSARYGKVWFHVRLMAYLSHVSSSVTPWIDDGVRDSRAIITSKAIRDLEAAQKSALSKLASEQSAALARIEKAALAAASASKAAETSAAIRRRDQRLCKGCSVHAGADRRTLCHTRVGTDGSAVGCPNAAQAASYPAGGYK